MTRILAALAGWKGYVAVLMIGLSIGSAGTWKVRDWMAAEVALKQARADLRGAIEVGRRTQAAAEITQDVGQAVEAARVETRVVYRTITERIPVYVTPEIDRDYPVPVGFVRLHDAAAAGGSAPTLSDRPGEPADAPSGIPLSAVADTVTGNYAGCADDRARLKGWQDWYAEQRAAWDRVSAPAPR